jgi:hypothetical protein
MDIKVPFLKEEIGAGDVVKAVTTAAGIKPCGGCQKRAAALNNALRFTPRTAPAPGPSPHVPSVAAVPAVWTAPPEVPDGWLLVRECGNTRMYQNGGNLVVWDIEGGQYKRSHTFCCGMSARAEAEFRRRCPQV